MLDLFNRSSTYNYYKAPDGEEVLEKLVYIMKPATVIGLGLASLDVGLYSHPKTYTQALGRFAYISAPVLGIAGTFVIASNLSGSIRKKDDNLNWIIGGLSSGGIFGAWRKSTAWGLLVGTAFAMAAFGLKWSAENNYVPFPTLYTQYGGCHIMKQDFTLIQERPKNWTTGSDK